VFGGLAELGCFNGTPAAWFVVGGVAVAFRGELAAQLRISASQIELVDVYDGSFNLLYSLDSALLEALNVLDPAVFNLTASLLGACNTTATSGAVSLRQLQVASDGSSFSTRVTVIAPVGGAGSSSSTILSDIGGLNTSALAISLSGE
jgi:hypothetical protein